MDMTLAYLLGIIVGIVFGFGIARTLQEYLKLKMRELAREEEEEKQRGA